MPHCVLLKLDFIATKIGDVLLFPPTRARSDATATMFALILQPLVDSGHIGAKEVENLAQVSQEMNEATMEDSIWASFCQREYPCISNYKLAFLEKKGYR
jgi:hypothetical protein